MDVVGFRDFYASPLGRVTAQLLQRQLATLTPIRADQTMMGLGFASPYLLSSSNHVALSFMMARQGVIHWPHDAENSSALVDEADLPLLESVVDLALVVHGLEHAETPLDMLQEVWRVLAPQGRLILVVPNRKGLWAASESTPFGYGQPFSARQITGLLKDSKFTVTQWRSALYLPPLRNETVLKAAVAFDTVGQRMISRFAGVTIVEAMKQVYAFSSGKRARRFVPRFRPVLLPAPNAVPQEHARRGSHQS
jgi:SAM-dependent methyltransferase